MKVKLISFKSIIVVEVYVKMGDDVALIQSTMKRDMNFQ